MTKVQIHLGLQRPLDDEMMKRIRDANSIYGIEHVEILPSFTELMVEYDATRLKHCRSGKSAGPRRYSGNEILGVTDRTRNFAILYRRAFAEFGTMALWNTRLLTPTPEDALVVARALRIEGKLQALVRGGKRAASPPGTEKR